MAKKEEKLVVKGKVIEALPNTAFRIELETGQIIFAYLSGRLRKNHIKVLVEDKVLVELSLYDLTKGRIVRRL